MKVVPVIQRTAGPRAPASAPINLLSKKKNRRALAERIAEFVTARGFDGVNLDFEPIPAKVADEYVLLVREVRAALDALDPGAAPERRRGARPRELRPRRADRRRCRRPGGHHGLRLPHRAPRRGRLHRAAGRVGAAGDLSTSVEAALEQTAGDGGRLVLALPWYGLAWSTQSAAAGRAGAQRQGHRRALDGRLRGRRAKRPRRCGRRYDSPSRRRPGRPTPPSSARAVQPPGDRSGTTTPTASGPRSTSRSSRGSPASASGRWAWSGPRGDVVGAAQPAPAAHRRRRRPTARRRSIPETVQGDIDGRDVVRGIAPLRLFARRRCRRQRPRARAHRPRSARSTRTGSW